MKTVLAAINYSRVSRKVLATAIEIARAIGGRVVVLNSVPPPAIATDVAPLVGEVIQLTDELERASRRHLRRIQKQLAVRGVSVEAICEQGFPVPLILAHARDLGARYVVLGSEGHSAFHDLIVGSTASGVLKRSPCPVVIVPAAAPRGIRGKNRRTRLSLSPSRVGFTR